MNSYAQNSEDIIVQEYFGDFVGTLLSIGENDGKTLSNSLALIELGWEATLVEASPSVFPRLMELHSSRTDSVELLQCAVGKENGKAKFFDSGELLGSGDISLVSTLKTEETKRWKSLKMPFEETEVYVVDVKTLLEKCVNKKFEYVTIDIEGMEIDVVPQIDFKELSTRLCIVEWNGKEAELYDRHMSKFDLKLIHTNQENRIYAL